MKLRIETADEDEIVIRCKKMDNNTRLIYDAVKAAVDTGLGLTASLNGREFRVPAVSVLFFESDDGKTALHTASGMYYVNLKLFELENLLPADFVRASKSCIVNVSRVSSFSRSLSGVTEVSFSTSDKTVFVSRSHYRAFRNKIDAIKNNRND